MFFILSALFTLSTFSTVSTLLSLFTLFILSNLLTLLAPFTSLAIHQYHSNSVAWAVPTPFHAGEQLIQKFRSGREVQLKAAKGYGECLKRRISCPREESSWNPLLTGVGKWFYASRKKRGLPTPLGGRTLPPWRLLTSFVCYRFLSDLGAFPSSTTFSSKRFAVQLGQLSVRSCRNTILVHVLTHSDFTIRSRILFSLLLLLQNNNIH